MTSRIDGNMPQECYLDFSETPESAHHHFLAPTFWAFDTGGRLLRQARRFVFGGTFSSESDRVAWTSGWSAVDHFGARHLATVVFTCLSDLATSLQAREVFFREN